MKATKNYCILFVTVLISLAFVGCSKDKKVERALYKKDGTWDITSVTWTQTIVDTSGPNIAMGTSTNAGTFTFDKGGEGTCDYTINGSHYTGSFNWSVKDEKISITKLTQTFDFSGNFTMLVISFSGTEKSKTEMTIEGSDTKQYSLGNVTQTVLTGTFSLKRR